MAATSLSFNIGLPPAEFFSKAWASEPLTSVLSETNIPFALPMPDEEISLVAKEDDQVVGQCSANKAVKYWKHLEQLNSNEQNPSTRVFVAIHKKAVKAEQEYLTQIKGLPEKAFHNAGIAVLPEHRGHGLGLNMTNRQIALAKDKGMTALFCETTNRYSATIIEGLGFVKVAQYPYETLAKELDHAELSKLDDFFTVWCLQV